ncbi:uncharacterized protein LOC133509124 isoform X2 [Syngnathoides biaculeatus]|uniref:uncharacterized protein LOC133509124 isoform X2 n=1 Tax=Syngnathoides biaculeatus TaxID=300417 RepID=UPI002ADDA623|nr:uncharacterized protein LOC133509124 isoform X2 [Syngnathoides biaculeatus]
MDAPVSSIHVVLRCQPQGQQLVTCSSTGGDNLQYSWWLNKNPLQQNDIFSGHVEKYNISLKQDISGRLRCSIRNNVSEMSEEVCLPCVFINCTSNGTVISQWLPEINQTLCDNPILREKSHQSKNYLLAMAGVLSGMVILLITGLAVFFMQKKKKRDTKDEEELVYADVKIVTQQRRSIKAREEMEVEYDQVKFSERARPPVVMNYDASFYAQVRRDR